MKYHKIFLLRGSIALKWHIYMYGRSPVRQYELICGTTRIYYYVHDVWTLVNIKFTFIALFHLNINEFYFSSYILSLCFFFRH